MVLAQDGSHCEEHASLYIHVACVVWSQGSFGTVGNSEALLEGLASCLC